VTTPSPKGDIVLGSAIAVKGGFLFNNHFLYDGAEEGSKMVGALSIVKDSISSVSVSVDLDKVVRYLKTDIVFFPYKHGILCLNPEALGMTDTSTTLTLFDFYQAGVTSTSRDWSKDAEFGDSKLLLNCDYVSVSGSCGSPVLRRSSTFVGIHSSTRGGGVNQFVRFDSAFLAWFRIQNTKAQ